MLLLNFLLTFIIELIIFYLILRRDYTQTTFYVLLINAFSWPIANLIYGFWGHLVFIELAVFFVEGFIIMLLFNLNWKKAFFMSFVANIVSAAVGLILFI